MNITTTPDGEIILESITDEELQEPKIFWDKVFAMPKQNIFPRPVIRDGNGKLTKDYLPRDWYLKLQEEIFEAMNVSAFKDNCAEEVADIITVCVSWLETLGFDEQARSELFHAVNFKNHRRGYFKGE